MCCINVYRLHFISILNANIKFTFYDIIADKNIHVAKITGKLKTELVRSRYSKIQPHRNNDRLLFDTDVEAPLLTQLDIVDAGLQLLPEGAIRKNTAPNSYVINGGFFRIFTKKSLLSTAFSFFYNRTYQ